MEAHEGFLLGITVPALDILFIKVGRNRVVDIQQGDRILAHACADEFAERAVDIHLAGHRNPASGQTAVDVTGHKAELGLECGPAFARNGNVLAVSPVSVYPVKEGQLILCQLLQDFRLFIACTKLCFHIFYHIRDAGIPCMAVKCLEQIQFRVFLNLNPQIVKLLNWRVARQEV